MNSFAHDLISDIEHGLRAMDRGSGYLDRDAVEIAMPHEVAQMAGIHSGTRLLGMKVVVQAPSLTSLGDVVQTIELRDRRRGQHYRIAVAPSLRIGPRSGEVVANRPAAGLGAPAKTPSRVLLLV